MGAIAAARDSASGIPPDPEPFPHSRRSPNGALRPRFALLHARDDRHVRGNHGLRGHGATDIRRGVPPRKSDAGDVRAVRDDHGGRRISELENRGALGAAADIAHGAAGLPRAYGTAYGGHGPRARAALDFRHLSVRD